MTINISSGSNLLGLIFDSGVDFLQTRNLLGYLFQDLMNCFGAVYSDIYVKFKGDSFDLWVKFIEDINNKLMFIIFVITFIPSAISYTF